MRMRGSGLVALGALAGVAGAGAFLKRALPSSGDELSDEVSLVAVFEEMKSTSRASAFRGGAVLAWLGGVELDLREASLAPAATLSTHALLGGVLIRTPPDWRVVSQVQVLLGGVDVPRDEEAPADAPTLTLTGLALLGGISVRA